MPANELNINLESFKNLLENKNISKIAIIDDAYDYEVKDEKIKEFVAFSEKDDSDNLNELKLLIGETIDDNVVETNIKQIWESKDGFTNATLKVHCDTLFSDLDQKHNQLKKLKNIFDDLDIETKIFGTDDCVECNDIQLVFLDYYLGLVEDQEATKRSIKKAEEIMSSCRDNQLPFIVLMSHVVEVKLEEDLFRKKSHLMRGLFRFICKENIENTNEFYIKLYSWIDAISSGNKINSLLNEITNNLLEVKNNLKKKLYSLTIEDFSCTNSLKLKEEKVKIGDYFLNLFGELIRTELIENKKVKSAVNSINEEYPDEDIIITSVDPSIELSILHTMSIFEANRKTNFEENVEFGDVLLYKKNLLMVLNPECDLIRDMYPKYSIIFILGKLCDINEKIEGGKSIERTHLFAYKNIIYRIDWILTEICTVPYGDIKEWMSKKKYNQIGKLKHIGKFKQVQAHKIREKFTNKLSRIGLATSPPMRKSVDVEIFTVGKEGKYIKYEKEFKNCGNIYDIVKDKNVVRKFSLNSDGLLRIIESGDDIIGKYEEIINDSSINGPLKQAFINRKDKIKKLKEANNWKKLLKEPADVRENKPKPYEYQFLGLTLNKDLRNKESNCSFPFILNIINESGPAHE